MFTVCKAAYLASDAVSKETRRAFLLCCRRRGRSTNFSLSFLFSSFEWREKILAMLVDAAHFLVVSMVDRFLSIVVGQGWRESMKALRTCRCIRAANNEEQRDVEFSEVNSIIL